MALAALQMVNSHDSAAALLEPTRLRLLGALDEPQSAAGLARKTGLPRQRVNYHLRELENAGLVELVEERKKGNCMERIVRATARSYLINPAILGAMGADPSRIDDRFSSAYLVAVAARAIREVSELRDRADRAGKKLASLTIETDVRFATAEDRNAFAEDLANEVAKLAAEYHDDSAAQGREFRFFIGGYPAITKPEDSTETREDGGTQSDDRARV